MDLVVNDCGRIEALGESFHGSRFVPTIADEPSAAWRLGAVGLDSGGVLRAVGRVSPLHHSIDKQVGIQ
jgi:hypothetical protein